MGNNYKVTDSRFGISWIESAKTYRLALGNRNNESDPFFQKYYSVRKHGTKTAALQSAKADRERQLKTPEFKAYFRHQVNGKRVKRPRNPSTVGVTGVVFSRGVRDLPSTSVNPQLMAFSCGELLAHYPMRMLSAQKAYHYAVKTRYAVERRRYRVKEVEALFQTWISKPEVKQFLEQYSIPVYPEDL
ncbi:hypothetical protein [Marinimicrobium sp. ABcell2]|uniref:hypothetical protein n=1 Tax=Marinimicrobium sp. ABcell2 TaxID=3069751 RepID=UPI0027B7F73A|nr:hypothetical protein [Marinimicrobium sp. ABcell2]MDQ2077370.1 hypothetical protein [Marinimicrobium sp. ABcell2]